MVEDLSAINISVSAKVPVSSDENPTLPGIASDVVVIRSKKRKRNISAYRQGGKIVISIPARLSKAEERQWAKAYNRAERAMLRVGRQIDELERKTENELAKIKQRVGAT